MNEHIPAEDFAAYVDGMLRPEKRNELENHFARCPACLDELVEIAAIMSGRDKVLAGNRGKIPAEFLKLALGEKNKTAKSVLHLRLVFEVAAAFVVVIFIGYLFLSGNRFWQTSEQMKPSVVTNKNVHLAEPAASFRDRVDARKTKSEQVEADAGLELDDSSVPSKRENAVVEKSLPAGRGNSLRASASENKLQEIAKEQPQPADKKDSLQEKKLARTEMAPEVVGAVQMDFAVRDQKAARVMEKKATEAKQNLERQKELGSGAALPIESQAKTEKLKDEESSLKSSVTVQATSGTAQLEVAGKKQDAALAREAMAAKKTIFPIRIEGDVAWTDLRNPELIFTWSWLQKGLALELQIDGAGTVTAVVPLGKIDPLLAKQAENEAKKLLFPFSKKKLRRARLFVNDLSSN